ncbi:MAG: corrinoid protein [Candidatus Omnitrophica bacterium]|nr:corrinoid protein [Candidatus Omnitrophota bacterium]
MDWQKINDAVFDGNINLTLRLVSQAVSEGESPRDILENGLIAGMSRVGAKFKLNEIFVPEVLIAAKAMHSALTVLEPFLASSGVEPKATIVIGTVKGDLHDIGKNLVVMMLKGAGFNAIDIGIDVSADVFIDKALSSNASLIAMSSLLTTSMPSMKTVVEKLKQKGLHGRIKTIIGGAPVTQEYADYIGADGYAQDASSAVDKAKELLGLS